MEKNCLQCGNPFTPKLNRAKFCSSACRAKHSRLHPSEASPQLFEGIPEKKPTPAPSSTQIVATMGALPPHAQYIITSQEREINRWEENYREEKKKREAAETKLAELKDQIKEQEHKAALNGIESELKKPGMDDKIMGFLQTPFGEKLGGLLLEKLISPAGPQLAGANGQLDASAQNQVAEIANWYSSLPEDLRAQVYSLLQQFAGSKPETLPALLKRIQNLLKTGSTMNGHSMTGANAAMGFN